MERSVWHIIALHTPRVTRRCSRCDAATPFASSDRFRVNANKRRLDVWLIYRCVRCEQPWNLPVVERSSPQQIGRDRLARYHANDRGEAWRVAFDHHRLARLGVDVDFATEVSVEREPGPAERIAFRLEYPCRVRLDRLLAGELGLSRRRLQGLGICPRQLRRPVRDGQYIALVG